MKKYLILFLSIVVSYASYASNPLDELPSGPLSLSQPQVERLYGALFQHAPQQDIEVKAELLATVFGQPINPGELKETEFNELLERSSQWAENTLHIPFGASSETVDTQASDFAIVIPKGDYLSLYNEQLETLVTQLNNPLLIYNVDSLVPEDGVLNLTKDDFTQSSFRLRLSNPKVHATQIGNEFLGYCASLTSFDTRGLQNVTQIGDQFLYGCKNLTSFDTRGLQNVTQIGDAFLSRCYSLTSFDTQGLQNVTQIGDDFLFDCKSLTRFDTRGLQNVTQIGQGLLGGCLRLTTFDPRGLQNVTQIGDWFLLGCNSLTSFDTRGLQNVTQIRQGFLFNCINLTSFDTRGLQNVTQIGDGFLESCSSLTRFDTRGLQNVTQIGDSFLDGCDELNSNAEQLKFKILKRGQANRLMIASLLSGLRFFIETSAK